MKKKVIEFFQNLPEQEHEQFNIAFELYRSSVGKNLGTERNLNSSGYSKRNLENLLYDLQKMHEITDLEKVVTSSEVRGTNDEEGSKDVTGDGTGVTLPLINPDDHNDLQEDIDVLNAEKEDLEDENEDLKDENESLKSENETLKALKVADAVSIREEFQFLKEADCPDELKILVADKITAWNIYVDAQRAISQAAELNDLSNDELAALAKISVDAFDENQKIYEELNCYATFKRVLGIHPIFKKLQLSREVEIMTADELIAYKGSSAKYFSVNKTALAKAEKEKDTDKITEITNRVAERSEKLFLVNKKLGVTNK
jgi:hypothetical protein